jgi:distribution and morphology protein 31
LDRRHIEWEDDWVPTRREAEFGDFELDTLVIKDALVSILNPHFRPFNLSIFHASMRNFRKHWMFYDTLCADTIIGSFDDCLFSVHKPQTKDLAVQKQMEKEWSRLSNLKIYGLPVDHFNTGISGPLSWITKGTVDLDLHFLVPRKATEGDFLDKILEEVDDLRGFHRESVAGPTSESGKINADIISLKDIRHYGLKNALRMRSAPNIETRLPEKNASEPSEVDREDSNIVILAKLGLRDLKASVPLIPTELSYMSNALIRPIVGYMNSNKTFIPLMLKAKVDIKNFDGSWDIYDSGLADIMSEEAGRAMSELVNDGKEASKRLKQIGLWSVAEISNAIINLFEHAKGDRGKAVYSGFDDY